LSFSNEHLFLIFKLLLLLIIIADFSGFTFEGHDYRIGDAGRMTPYIANCFLCIFDSDIAGFPPSPPSSSQQHPPRIQQLFPIIVFTASHIIIAPLHLPLTPFLAVLMHTGDDIDGGWLAELYVTSIFCITTTFLLLMFSR
jgi:hypothetical protein